MNKGPALYTTQLGAGLGMIKETLDLLRIWEPGENAAKLAEKAVSTGLFSRATARRTRNIVAEMFAPRFLIENGVPAQRLQFLTQHGFPNEAVSQLLFLYTARAQAIFRGFLIEVYWPKYSAGASGISLDEAERFVFRALDSGHMEKRWADSVVKKNSSYLLGCCADFELLSKSRTQDRAIQRFSMHPNVAAYLAYDLHFSGLSDSAVIQSPDWMLFGYEFTDVLGLMKDLMSKGHLLVQSSGELVQISWKYRSMEESLNALIER